jgi:hypothetical protein
MGICRVYKLQGTLKTDGIGDWSLKQFLLVWQIWRGLSSV